MEGHRFWCVGGGSEKNCKMGGGTLPTMGNPEICYLS